jgi:hypothetical protein
MTENYIAGNHKETEAETMVYLVCSRCGLETNAIGYVAGHLTNPEEDPSKISIKVILDVARKIEEMARYASRNNDHLLKKNGITGRLDGKHVFYDLKTGNPYQGIKHSFSST